MFSPTLCGYLDYSPAALRRLSSVVALIALPLSLLAAPATDTVQQATIGKTFAESVPAPTLALTDSKAPNVLVAVQMNEGMLEFAMMNVDLSPFRLRAPASLPAGPVTLSVDFQRLDDGADITLFADGREVARGKMVAHLPRLSLSASEGFDIGTDSGSTVDAEMMAAPDFNGEIERVDVRIR